MNRTITFTGLTDLVVEAVKSVLEQQGYKIQRSFDLQSAVRHPVRGCPCSHHGTDDCTCQYVVLLAYPRANRFLRTPPRVFTAHGYGELTGVTLQHDATLDQDEEWTLVSALIKAAMLLRSSESTTKETEKVSAATH